MKILMINLPYYGHVVPTLGLVQQLISKGCRVKYLMPFDWKEMVIQSGAEFVGYQNHRQLSEQIRNAYAAAEQLVSDVDVVLYEQFFFLGKHLADKYHKPAVRIFTSPATNRKLMDEYIQSGPLSIFKHKWIARAFTKNLSKGISLKTDNWLDEIIENPPGLNLVYTLKEYQPYQEEFDQKLFKFIGPSIYDRHSEHIEFIKKDRPVIYVSLGTVLKGTVSFYKICMEAFEDEAVDVIISTGNHFKHDRFRRVPENVHFYSFIPQLDVLKLADVFVTHGGMNSVSEALINSVPMVVIPMSSDQPVNARCVEKLGVGKVLSPSSVSSETLRNTVVSVMNDTQIKQHFEKIGDMIHASAGNEGAAEMIMSYVKANIEN